MQLIGKKLQGIVSVVIVLLCLAFLSTPSICYTGFTRGDYFSAFSFELFTNTTILAISATLIGILGFIGLFNLVCTFIPKFSSKALSIFNIVALVVALGFAITFACSKYIAESYTPTNSVSFVVLLTIVAVILSIVILVKAEPEK